MLAMVKLINVHLSLSVVLYFFFFFVTDVLFHNLKAAASEGSALVGA